MKLICDDCGAMDPRHVDYERTGAGSMLPAPVCCLCWKRRRPETAWADHSECKRLTRKTEAPAA